MRAQVPCLNCLDREIGCHSTCRRYIYFKESKQSENKVIKDFLKRDAEHAGYMKEQRLRRERKGKR